MRHPSWSRGGAVAAMLAALTLSSPVEAVTGFESWLRDLEQEAVAKGLSAGVVRQALTGVRPLPRVIELDRSQPEFKLTYEQYLTRVVSEARVREGIEKFRSHAPELERVGAKYGVQPRFIAALWGIETNYGRTTGGFPVIASLVTLAHDGRRSAFFRRELLAALRILDEGHIPLARMKGSWAGAMGQSQFMPTSFHQFAVDENGDGRRDIWTTQIDVFASIANYLAGYGWRDDQIWGRQVRLPAGFDFSQADLKVKRPLTSWSALGVRRFDGSPLPQAALEASVVAPDDAAGRAYLVYGNFDRIMRWNRSTYFATAVGILSDRIRAGVE